MYLTINIIISGAKKIIKAATDLFKKLLLALSIPFPSPEKTTFAKSNEVSTSNNTGVAILTGLYKYVSISLIKPDEFKSLQSTAYTLKDTKSINVIMHTNTMFLFFKIITYIIIITQ